MQDEMHRYNVYTDKGDYLGVWARDREGAATRVKCRTFQKENVIRVERAD